MVDYTNMAQQLPLLTFDADFDKWFGIFDLLTTGMEDFAIVKKFVNLCSMEVLDFLRIRKAAGDKFATFKEHKDVLYQRFVSAYNLHEEWKSIIETKWGTPTEIPRQLAIIEAKFERFYKAFKDGSASLPNSHDHPLLLQFLLRSMPNHVTDSLLGSKTVKFSDFISKAEKNATDPTVETTEKLRVERDAKLTPKKSRVCSHCKKSGHTFEKCWNRDKPAEADSPKQPAEQRRSEPREGTSRYPPRTSTKQDSKKTQTLKHSPTRSSRSITRLPDHVYVKVAIRDGDDQVREGHFACLDPGSTITIMNIGLARFLKAPLHQCDDFATLPDGSRTDIKQYTKLDFTIEGVTKTLRVYVMEQTLVSLLFGLDALISFSIGMNFGRNDGPASGIVTLDDRVIPTFSTAQAIDPSISIGETTSALIKMDEPIQSAKTESSEPCHVDYDINNELSPALSSLCTDLLSNFDDIFYTPGTSQFWQAVGVQHTIPVSTETAPRTGRRTYSPKKQEIINQQFEDWEAAGIIEPCPYSEYRNHPVVAENNGKNRVCFDYRALNKVTLRSPYPSKNLRTVLNQFEGARWISKLDLTSSYLQVPIAPEDRPKTAFMTRNGLYQMVGMAFGLMGAGDTMQRLMDKILEPYTDFTINYMDDTWVVTRSDDFNLHLRHLRKVFEIFRERKLYTNRSKCKFAYREMDALGHIVSGGITRVPDARTQAFNNLAPPQNKKELTTILGMFGFYRRFIQSFAEIALPLTELTRTDAAWTWNEKHQTAFDHLKAQMVSPPILCHPDPDSPYLLRTDASGFATGAALLQEHGGIWLPVAYFSKKLKPQERNYTTTERELLAVIHALKEWETLLEGASFTLETDHVALRSILDLKEPPNPRIARWIIAIQRFMPFEVRHKPGKQMQLPDALSRNPILAFTQKSQSMTDTLAADQRADPLLNSIIESIDSDTVPTDDEALKFWKNYRTHLEIHDGRLVYVNTDKREDSQIKIRPVIPPSRRQLVMTEFHNSATSAHLGFKKTYARIRQKFWWPKMWQEVELHCKNCDICSRARPTNNRPTGELKASHIGAPNLRIATDFIGPLPETTSKNRYILTFIDCFTGWPEAIATPDCTAETFTKHFIDLYICRHNPPREILSDNGPAFAAAFTKELIEKAGTKQLFTPTYHPESNPAERLNQTIGTALRALVEQHKTDWDYFIPFALRGIRVSPNERTGFSPYYLHYGHEPSSPLEISWNLQSEQLSPEAFANKLAREVPLTQLEALLNHEKARQKEDRALKSKSNKITFSPGDWVMVEKKSFPPGVTPKLTSRYEGPYKIIAATNASEFIIRYPSEDVIIHVRRLKRYLGDPPHDPTPHVPFNPDEEEVDPTQDIDADNIIGKRISVYWKRYKQFYRGTVTARDKQKHVIKYDEDGDSYTAKLFGSNRVKWKLLTSGRREF